MSTSHDFAQLQKTTPVVTLQEHWHAVPGMRDHMAATESLLTAIASEEPSAAVRRISLHLIGAGGKRLRPALVLLSGDAVSGRAAEISQLAAAMELLHVATLYHDDVIDGAETRRGLPSSNAVWGDRISAMAGTYLIAKAMEILAAYGDQVLNFVNRAVNQVWCGEMRELEGVYALDRTESAYFDCIANKTAAFCQLPCCLGALGAGGDEQQVGALSRFGQYVGTAFQLVDDVLDLVASDKAIGKPAGNDMKAGVYTLPVIRTLRTNTRLHTLLDSESLSDEQCQEALQMVRAGDGIDYALERAGEFITQALAELEAIAEGPSKQALCNTARSIIERPEFKRIQREYAYES
jgi:heptaprenyl diphosphate synthase